MGARLIIVARIRFQNSAQMRLAQDNDVVHTFTPDRSDQPFGKPATVLGIMNDLIANTGDLRGVFVSDPTTAQAVSQAVVEKKTNDKINIQILMLTPPPSRVKA